VRPQAAWIFEDSNIVNSFPRLTCESTGHQRRNNSRYNGGYDWYNNRGAQVGSQFLLHTGDYPCVRGGGFEHLAY
jgi:hypothetical protein